jgi:hypothetical protein
MEMREVGTLLDQQSQLCDVMVCFNSALGSLCSANNIPFGNPSGFDDTKGNASRECFIAQPVAGPLETSFSRQLYSTFEVHGMSAAARNSLCAPVQFQCRAIDQAFMLASIQNADLLQHIDTLYEVFLLSENGNFVVTFTGLLVDSHLAANTEMGFAASAHRHVEERSSTTVSGGGALLVTRETNEDKDKECFTHMWATRGVSSAFQRAKQYSQTANINLASFRLGSTSSASAIARHTTIGTDDDEILYILSDRGDPSSPVHVVSGFRYDHLVNAFTTRGLDRIHIDYAAPWPFNMILSTEYMDRLSLVSRRLLEIAQLTALSREVFGHMTHSKRAKRGQSERHSGAVDRYRVVYLSFCQIRQAFQAIANFTADRLRTHKKMLKRDLFLACLRGFGPFMTTMRQHVCRLVDDVFILPHPSKQLEEEVCVYNAGDGLEQESENEEGKESTTHSSQALVAESISALLESCRVCLYILYKELLKADPDGISVITTAMSVLKSRIIAIRVHSEQLEMVTNGNVECLLMYLESAE